jgi:hypothetical protein
MNRHCFVLAAIAAAVAGLLWYLVLAGIGATYWPF